MGLDFQPTASGVRLAQGSYIVVQAPDPWDWSDYVWDVSNGSLVQKSDGSAVPYNYVVFSITKM